MNEWTPERRARQAELIGRWKPWEKSKGPRSEEGKAAVSMNGYRGGQRAFARVVARLLREAAR